MMLAAMARLPDELMLSILDGNFPSRQSQIRTLATLIDVSFKRMEPAGTVPLQKSCVVLILLLSQTPPHAETVLSMAPRPQARVLWWRPCSTR